MSKETHPQHDDHEDVVAPTNTAPDNVSSDELVEARWDVSVIPGDTVSIHYTVSPRDEKDAITSVSASFVLLKSGIILETFAGSSVQDLIAPRPGQGVTGDTGVDVRVFPSQVEGQLTAILAGTVRHDEEIRSFFFQRSFDPNET